MTLTRKQESRLLSADEQELVIGSHQPEVEGLSDVELATLRKLLRGHRDRATDIARQQRRELRGKARPRGARSVTADDGSKSKATLLTQAVKRLNKEAGRREQRRRA